MAHLKMSKRFALNGRNFSLILFEVLSTFFNVPMPNHTFLNLFLPATSLNMYFIASIRFILMWFFRYDIFFLLLRLTGLLDFCHRTRFDSSISFFL